MLTKEILLANSTLAGLSTEQIEAIATLSQNDEAAVIAKKTSEIYGGLDADILVASGVEKSGGEKTYDYAKRVIGALKKSVDGAKGNADKIAALEADKAKLQAELEKGGGEELQKQLNQSQTDLKSVMEKYNTLKADYDKAQSDFAAKLLNTRLDADLAGAAKGLKIKSGIPSAAAEILMKQAFTKLKASHPEYIENADGTQSLIFKDADGAVMRNPNNTLKANYDKAQSDFAAKLLNTRLDADLAGAAKGLKIKSGIPSAAAEILMKQAFAKLKASRPEYIDNADGTQSLIFKDADGAVMRNPNNTLNPYTAAELLRKELGEMGVLENRQGKGTGTSTDPNPAPAGVIDISGAKNQREAYEIIDKALTAQGKVVGSRAYQDAMDAAWKENNIVTLPK